MSTIAKPVSRCANALLAALSAEEFHALEPQLQPIHLDIKTILGERGAPCEYVYFPCTCVLSMLVYMSNGTAVETGTAGKEGFCGIEILADGDRWAETVICQIDGDCLRMTVGDFRKAVAGNTALRRITQRYMLVYLNLVSQSVACNRLHSIEERFARWILMTHDRVNGNEFYLTQEFLSDMLGVHRPGVSLVAATFQQAGFLKYRRGNMEILNREGLEDTCCECYRVVNEQMKQLLG